MYVLIAFMYVYCIAKYSSTSLYIGMDKVPQHHGHTFEKSDLNFQFQCEFTIANFYFLHVKMCSYCHSIFVFAMKVMTGFHVHLSRVN